MTAPKPGERLVIWENRRKPLSSTAMHRWWHRCLEIAGVPPHPIREARHTPITDFLRATGNLKLAQQLARHRTIQTTADIYGHLDDIDLERALEAVASLTADDHSFRDQPFPSEDR